MGLPRKFVVMTLAVVIGIELTSSFTGWEADPEGRLITIIFTASYFIIEAIESRN